MKKILLAVLIVFAYRSSVAQCSLKELSLPVRASNSDLIVEGKVVAKKSYWNDAHNMIYTSNTVEVYKVFKGTLSTSSIVVLTMGGTVDYDRITADPSLTLRVGETGIFTCETVKRFTVPNAQRSLYPTYEAYGSSQGFIKYDLAGQTASDPFRVYNDIEKQLYNVVLAPSMRSWQVVTPFDIHNNSSTQKAAQNLQISSISGFSPTTVTAGTGSTITITGTSFGSTQGTGTVGFKNADDGGATYINPLASQYVSWSNTQIVVEVPQNAGTGTIQVTQGTTQTSTATLTVSYAHLNVDFDPGTGTEAYGTDHINDNSAGGYTWTMSTGFNSSTSAKASFLRAFDTWRCATGVNWTVSSSTTSINDAVSDGTNIICFDNTAPLSAGVLGTCYSYWSGCASGATIVWYVSELDIIFDEGSNISPLTWEYGTATPSSSEYDFETVAVHELGHGHQLGHVISSGAIMHYSISNGTSNRSLSTNDLAGGNYVQAKSIVANICGSGAMTNYTCVSAPVAAFSGSPTTVCAGATVAFTDASTNSPTSWSWTFTGGTPATSTSQNPSVVYSTSGTYAVSLTATNSAGSDVETISGYITVNASPTGTISKTNLTCNGAGNGSATITASGGAGGYTYSWSPSGGSTSTASSLAAGTYSCTVTDANGCTLVASTTITQPSALSVSSSNVSVCSGSSASLSASSSGGTGSVTFSWMPGSLSGTSVSVSPSATATYTVTGTDANGCTGTATPVVTVNAIPSVSASASPASISSGSSSTLTGSGASTYAWMPGSLSGTSVSVSPTATQIYTVTGTSSQGCSNTANVTVTVTSGGVTKLQTAYCGITETSLNQTLYCDAVSGATKYRYEITAPDNSVYVYTRTTNLTNFQMNWVSGVGYGKTYSVKVAALVGTWSAYGTACSVTTPSDPTTQLSASYCGITETSLTQVLYCDAVTGATNYRYEITDPSNAVVVYTRSNSLTNFQMSWVSSVGYNKTYSIKVAAYVGGAWLPYGSACSVTTPSDPSTQLATSSCGITETSLTQVLYCNAVTGATNYRYEITDPSNVVVVYTRANSLTNFQMSWVSSVTYNKTYSIRVAPYVGGAWLAYGSACSVTTPVSAIMENENNTAFAKEAQPQDAELATGEFELKAFPNPTTGIINIECAENVNALYVYSITGTLVSASFNTTVASVEELTPGIYFLVVKTDKGAKRIKIIKE
jgi:hypothetical protein